MAFSSELVKRCLPDALGQARLELQLCGPVRIQGADGTRGEQLPSRELERSPQPSEVGYGTIPPRERAALAAPACRQPLVHGRSTVEGATARQQGDPVLRVREELLRSDEGGWPSARRLSRLARVSSMRSVLLQSTRIYDRVYVLAIFTVAYVALAAIRYEGVRIPAAAALVVAPIVLAWVWRHTRLAEGASPAVHPAALGALRFCAWGATLWVAARAGPAGRPGFDLAANLGAGLAVVAAHVALARVPEQSGLVRPPPSAHALDAAGFCALMWGCASALPAARTFWRGQGLLLDPLATDYATSAASIASVLVLLGAAVRMRLTRRLELGVLDRAAGAVALTAAAFAVALPAALADLAPPDRALPLGAIGAALACAWAATVSEATRVATALRGALVVMLLGAPIALAAAAGAQHMPAHAGLIALGGATATLVVGIVARAVAKPLTPEQSRWLEALGAAGLAAREPDPEAAIVATLSALTGLDKNLRLGAELWRAEPAEVLSVDVAGYLRTSRATAPGELYELARGEPERMLRRDVLAALEVRRPEVRPLLGWMDGRGLLAVTLVCDEQLPLGLISFPKGSRKSPLTLEEAIAARELCDRLSAVLSLSSSIARSRRRETEARERADELVVETAKLEALIELRTRPRDHVLEALAANVQVAAYGARARATLEALAKLAAAGSDVALEVPVGVDALGHAALVHLGSPRRAEPFVIVDGTAANARDPAQFRPGADTFITRARAGTLAVLNAASLPLVVQDALAVALSERPAAGVEQAPPFALVASLPRSAAELLDARQLSSALARFLVPNAVALPRLDERREDLRGLVLDALCRSGVRFDGQTLGVEPSALSVLLDHPWPGNGRQLADIVERAARAAVGARVRIEDLAATGFSAASAGSPARTPSAELGASAAPAIDFRANPTADPSDSARASRLGSEAPRINASLVVPRRGRDAASAEKDADAASPLPPEPRSARRRRRR
jgi:DNA-binding NtrC family response regulator